MRPLMRSTVRAASVGLMAVAACFTQATGSAAAAEDNAAPPCVQYSTSWRYTLVTNNCDSTQHLTTEYRVGPPVPCRTVGAGDTVTFPGYGTENNQVLAVTLCSATSP